MSSFDCSHLQLFNPSAELDDVDVAVVLVADRFDPSTLSIGL
jgi:hypothetical protein